MAIKGDLERVNLKFKIEYKDRSDDVHTMNIDHAVESYIPHIWNHVCVNMYDLITANSELSNNRKPGSSVLMEDISISRSLYVDDVWIGRVPLTGMSHVESYWLIERII